VLQVPIERREGSVEFRAVQKNLQLIQFRGFNRSTIHKEHIARIIRSNDFRHKACPLQVHLQKRGGITFPNGKQCKSAVGCIWGRLRHFKLQLRQLATADSSASRTRGTQAPGPHRTHTPLPPTAKFPCSPSQNPLLHMAQKREVSRRRRNAASQIRHGTGRPSSIFWRSVRSLENGLRSAFCHVLSAFFGLMAKSVHPRMRPAD